jgi:ParB-like nuclease domain
MSETRLVPLSKIKDNPWRDRVRNPIDADRVEAIGISISKTKKYWLGTYGREVKGGFVELAFGHHRYEAAKAQGLKEIPIIIEPFTDGEMLVWMAQENVRGELPVVIEAVSAAVKALGEGKIEIDAPDPKTKTSFIRHAPSFIAGKVSSTTVVDHPYTAYSVARYLGYVKKASNTAKDSVQAALGILERAEITSLEGGKEGTKKALEVEKQFSKKTVNEAIKDLSAIKQREVTSKIHAEQSAEEIRKADEALRIQQQKQRDREAKEKADHDELLRKQLEAVANEKKEEAKRLKQKMQEAAKTKEAKDEADKAKQAQLEEDVEAAKKAAEEQRKEDEYIPHRKEADRIIHILERRDLTEDLKALSRRPLTLKDKERVWEAIDGHAAWLSSWAAALFSSTPLPKSKRRS